MQQHHKHLFPLFFILPVALVPCPALLSCFGSEIWPTHVHDAGGEAQQPSVPIWPVHPGSRWWKTVLLMGTGQKMKGTVFQIGCLLDQLGIQNKVWGRWGISNERPFYYSCYKRWEDEELQEEAELTVWTADPSSLSPTSTRTVNVVVSTTLLNRQLCSHTVRATENYITCIWVTRPIPCLLSKEVCGERTWWDSRVFFHNEQCRSSYFTLMNKRAVTMNQSPSVHFILSSITQTVLMILWQLL